MGISFKTIATTQHFPSYINGINFLSWPMFKDHNSIMLCLEVKVEKNICMQIWLHINTEQMNSCNDGGSQNNQVKMDGVLQSLMWGELLGGIYISWEVNIPAGKSSPSWFLLIFSWLTVQTCKYNRRNNLYCAEYLTKMSLRDTLEV